VIGEQYGSDEAIWNKKMDTREAAAGCMWLQSGKKAGE
jgi:hypothetical protein